MAQAFNALVDIADAKILLSYTYVFLCFLLCVYDSGGYLSQACSSAETLATLYLRALKLGKSVASSPIPGPFRGSPGPTIETITGECYNGDFTDPALDRLIFSPVHYAW